MANLLNVLFNDTKNGDVFINGIGFHKCVLQSISYFNDKDTHDALELKISIDTTKLFKKWLYQQDITKDELNLDVGIEIRELSKHLDIKFYIDIHNQLFVYALECGNADIQFKYFIMFNMYSTQFKFGAYRVNTLDKSSYHYAYCLYTGNGIQKDRKKSYEIFKRDWEQNKNPDSLHEYANCIQYGVGTPKDEKKAIELYKFNWEQNKNSGSLNDYAYCLHMGIGTPKDGQKACELYKLNWEQNKNSYSLNGYAYCIDEGIGTPRNRYQAGLLYKLNWEQNRNQHSLHNYAMCLSNGDGVPVDHKKSI